MRNCRYVCSLAMHTGEMTVDEATRFFNGQRLTWGSIPQGERRSGVRLTPAISITHWGKLMILKLREDYRKEQDGGYRLKDFHDASAVLRSAAPSPA